jgi:hypothetical protein
MIDNIFILYIHYLITGWWYTYPPEKYESQIGSSSQLLGKIKAMFQTTNHANQLNCIVINR